MRRSQSKCRDFNDNDLPKCQVYTVVAGDSAIDIAQKFKASACCVWWQRLLADRRFRICRPPAVQIARPRAGASSCRRALCAQVDLDEMLALNNLTAADGLQPNFKVSRRAWACVEWWLEEGDRISWG